MDAVDIIQKLTSLHGVSGYEHRISGEIKDIFGKYCDSVETDNLGNVIALKKSLNNPKNCSVMIEAHMDEIGMMIVDIDDRGFLYFRAIGGIDARILLAKQVIVHGKKDIVGIIGAKPPHITTAQERSKAIPLKDLYIDTGYSVDEIKQIVSVGDTVTFCDKFARLGTDFVSTKSQDDRTSVAILVMIMDALKNVSLPFDVYFCACVQEEVGRRGAVTCATKINPTFAIAIDVCHATTPDASEDTFKASEGTVISIGPNIHPTLAQNIIKCADENKISYNIDADCGDTGTDAWAIQIARCGIPTALFSIPIRYMHTMVETAHLDDIKATAKAISVFLQCTKDAEAVVCFN